jgi:hypothetical protein
MSTPHSNRAASTDRPDEHPTLRTGTGTGGTGTTGTGTGTGGTGTTTGTEYAPHPPPQRDSLLLAATIVVGLWHAVLAIATTLLTLLWWPVVEQTASSTVQFRGFTFTLSSGVLLLAIVGGSAGSLVHTIAIFSSRVGRRTFETSFLWWYLLRPIGAVLLALIFVAAVSSGLLALSGGDGASSAALAFIAGALAGLFTDAVLQRLRGLLGATSTQEPASTQDVPHAPPPQG